MSIPAITRALRFNLSAPEKPILTALAFHADANLECFPSHQTLARETGYSKPTVKRALRRLNDQKIVRILKRQSDYGNLTTNLYILNFPDDAAATSSNVQRGQSDPTPDHSEPTSGHPDPTHRGTEPPTQDHDEPRGGVRVSHKRSIERSKERSNKRSVSGSRTHLSAEWEPSEVDEQFAKQQGLRQLDIDRAAEKFRNHHRRKGTRCSDWPSLWRDWVIEDAKRLGREPPSSKARITITPDSPQWNAWRAYYADNNNQRYLNEMNNFADKGIPFPVKEPWPPTFPKAA